ncbi:PQQ-binding-like beta-propeller repeat protein [Streptomyces sp. NBC_00829]|uniref:outer membrane protein assembly factor BamB family protein n=1 Tax=Streptomyces sp. NBC_00829 TaxID=2903679 RepID=UPI00386AC331
MEPLQQDDPRQIGPYTALARFGESAVSVRYLAQGPDGTTAVVSLARPELAELVAFRRRFASETRRTERLAGGWVAPIVSRTDASPPWTASPYVPALSLREAIALAGPLPERALRILGAGLAETLARVHAGGAVLHGLAPDTVLLAADGPRLTAFGALGAAAVAEARPDGQLTVKLGYLTPEQATGARPGPASDIFVLGLLLAYAATGTTPLGDADRIAHAEPDLRGVPDEVRPLLASCLAKLPQDRPSAGTVAAELALEGAAALARDGWLPPVLVRAVQSQAAAVESVRTGSAEVVPADGNSPAPEAVAVAGQASLAFGDGPRDAAPARAVGGPPDAVTAPGGGQLVPGAPRAAGGEPGTLILGGGADRVTTAPGVPPARAPLAPLAPLAGASGPPYPAPQTAGPLAPPNGTPLAPRAAGQLVPQAAGQPPAALPAVTRPVHLPVPVSPPVPPGALPGAAPGPPAGPGRRTLLVGIAAGAVGIALGSGAVYALGEGEGSSDSAPRTSAVPPRARVPGVPPEPHWRYEHPGKDTDPPPNATVWRDRVLVLTGGDGAVGVDVRTGSRLWQLKEAASLSRAVAVDDQLCLVDGASEFLWISARDGQIRHRVAKSALAGPGETLTLGGITGSDGSTLWMTGRVRKGAALATYFFAYDLVARKWLWRTPVTNGIGPSVARYDLIAARAADVVVRQDAASLTPAQRTASKGASVLLVLDRASGRARQSFALPGVVPAAAAVGDTTDKIFAAAAGELHAYRSRNGARLWRVAAAPAAGESGIFPFGKAVLRGPVLYAANRRQQVYAIDIATGRPLWQRSTEAPVWNGVPATGVTASGGTVVAGDGAQLTAFSARDGKRLWKFQEAGAKDTPGGARYVPLQGGGRYLVVQREGTFYALPVI